MFRVELTHPLFTLELEEGAGGFQMLGTSGQTWLHPSLLRHLFSFAAALRAAGYTAAEFTVA